MINSMTYADQTASKRAGARQQLGQQAMSIGPHGSDFYGADDMSIAAIRARSQARRAMADPQDWRGTQHPEFGAWPRSETGAGTQYDPFGPARPFYGEKEARMATGLDEDGWGPMLQSGPQIGGVANAVTAELSHKNIDYRFQMTDKLDGIDKLAMRFVLLLPNRLNTWMWLLDLGAHIPFTFITWRLGIELEMLNLIIAQSGLSTGANMIGNANMALIPNGIDKVLHGNLTFGHASVVMHPPFVRVLRDVYPRRYHCGWDTEAVENYEELRSDQRGSCIYTIHPATEKISSKRLDFVDTSKSALIPSVATRTLKRTDRPQWCNSPFYERVWHLSELQLANEEAVDGFYESSAMVTTTAWRGKHAQRRLSDREWVMDTGTGPLSGRRTGPGVSGVFRGTSRSNLGPQDMNDARPRVASSPFNMRA